MAYSSPWTPCSISFAHLPAQMWETKAPRQILAPGEVSSAFAQCVRSEVLTFEGWGRPFSSGYLL